MYYMGQPLDAVCDTKAPDLETDDTCLFRMQPSAEGSAHPNRKHQREENASLTTRCLPHNHSVTPTVPLYIDLRAERAQKRCDSGPEELPDKTAHCRGAECILGTKDRRQHVEEAEKWPWRVHGHLEMVFSDTTRYIGTGTLVGPRHVLTAGHNLYDHVKGKAPSEIYFFPGQSGHKTPWLSGSVAAVIHPTYRKAGTPEKRKAHDMGLVILEKPLGDELGFLGLVAPDAHDQKPTDVNVSGYPGSPGKGTFLYTMSGKVMGYDNARQRIYYDADTSAGQSGGGVWLDWPSLLTQDQQGAENMPHSVEKDTGKHPLEERDTLYCIATHTHGNDPDCRSIEQHFNSGTHITPDKLALLEKWISTYPGDATQNETTPANNTA